MTNILDKIRNYEKLEKDYKNQIIENGAKEERYLRERRKNKVLEQENNELLELLKQKDLEISKLKAPKKKVRSKKDGVKDEQL